MVRGQRGLWLCFCPACAISRQLPTRRRILFPQNGEGVFSLLPSFRLFGKFESPIIILFAIAQARTALQIQPNKFGFFE